MALNINVLPVTFGSDQAGIRPGLGFNFTYGKMLKRKMGFGIGAGLDIYGSNRGTHIVPIFAEMRGYLSEKKVSPFYRVGLGYGFNFESEEDFVVETKGGYMIDSQIGLRLGARSGVNFTIGAGIKIQDSAFRQEFPWNEGDYTEVDYTYRRLNLSFGIVF